VLAGAAPPTARRVSDDKSRFAFPAVLEAKAANAFGISIDAAREGVWVRCAGTKLIACWVGANLNCGKANTRRRLPGATAYCRANPNSDVVPMAATGHDTVYVWRCVGGRGVAGKAIIAVDAQGYAVGNWKELP
jgi:hypothetical protein